MSRPVFTMLAVCGVAVLCACTTRAPTSSDDSGTVVPDAPRSDGPVLESVSVFVEDGNGPVADALVTIDDAAGSREMATTDASGHATVMGVTWGSGAVTITAMSPHHPLFSLAGFHASDLGSRRDATGTITLPLVAYYEQINVSGNILGSADPSRPVLLYLDIQGQLDVTGTTFSGVMERARPFHVYAVDSIYSVLSATHFTDTPVAIARVTNAGLSTSGTFDVDMSTALPLTTVSGSFPMPSGSNRAQFGLPEMLVTSDDSAGRAVFGYASEGNATGGRCDFTVAQLATIDATSPVTVYSTQTNDGIYSEIRLDGLPTSSPAIAATDWLFPPRLVTPVSGGSASLYDPITFTDVDPTMPVYALVATPSNWAWTLQLPAGATQLTIPQPPPGADTSFWSNLTVSPIACEPWAGHNFDCRRDAGGDWLDATM